MGSKKIIEQVEVTDKFYVGDELHFCKGALEFAEIIEQHMGVEAREYFTELVTELIEEATYEADD